MKQQGDNVNHKKQKIMEIKDYGVRELTENEMRQIYGGNRIMQAAGWIYGQILNAVEWTAETLNTIGSSGTPNSWSGPIR